MTRKDVELADRIGAVANAITPRGLAPGHDATGGTVASLTEAVMGMTAALVQVAEGLRDIAEAIREGQTT